MDQNATVATRLVDALIGQGISHVFCVPGESYLSVLDALYDRADRIRVVTCRNEAGAANMAEAYGKMTGKPGVCMVTRGPGATHASIGVHTAQQDSTPMLLFVGQIARGHRGRGAFQEVDYRRMFGELAKGAIELEEADRVEEIVQRAFAITLGGRRGPVVISLPEDVLDEPAPASRIAPLRVAGSGIDRDILSEIADHLRRAERPLLILGGSGWSQSAASALADWADGLNLPIALSFRRKDLIDNRHPCYIGDLGLGTNPALAARVREADLLIAVGARLGDSATGGYTLLSPEETARKLIHIHAGPEEIGRVWPPLCGVAADVDAAATALTRLSIDRDWRDWRDAGRADLQSFREPVEVHGDVNLSRLFTALRAELPDDAIVANGAGNYAAWLHRYFPCHGFGTQLAPTSGAMGYGLPAAIAAKILHPDRDVVAVAGDGCFMMTAQELMTAVQHQAALIILVIDNGSYGTIRMHQEREFPGRVMATDLQNPDFVAFARSFGADAWRVDRTEDFVDAFRQARAASRPALIHIRTSVRDIAPGKSI